MIKDNVCKDKCYLYISCKLPQCGDVQEVEDCQYFRGKSISMIKDIENFHKKYKLSPLKKPGLLTDEVMTFRRNFLMEEYEELRDSYCEGDLEGVADALIDIIYVALGTAYLMGLPTQQLWDEVHTANMKKVRVKSSGESKRGSAYDVVKPDGWKAPDITSILKKAGS